MNTFNCKCGTEVSMGNPVHYCMRDDGKKGVRMIYLMNASGGKNSDPVYRKRFGSRPIKL